MGSPEYEGTSRSEVLLPWVHLWELENDAQHTGLVGRSPHYIKSMFRLPWHMWPTVQSSWHIGPVCRPPWYLHSSHSIQRVCWAFQQILSKSLNIYKRENQVFTNKKWACVRGVFEELLIYKETKSCCHWLRGKSNNVHICEQAWNWCGPTQRAIVVYQAEFICMQFMEL